MSNEPPELPSSPAQPDFNPYAPPSTDATQSYPGSLSEWEALRKPLLATEASIKGIGTLFIIGSVIVMITALSAGASIFELEDTNSSDAGIATVIIAVLGSIAVFQLITGIYLRKFKPWARICAIILSVISLLNIPVGTLIGIWFLVTLCGSKGSTVFTPRYQQAIRETPHLKYRTPMWIWILLGVLVLIFVGLILFGILADA